MPTTPDRRQTVGADQYWSKSCLDSISNVKAVLILVSCVFASACSSGPKNFSNDNDELRKTNLTLAHKVQELEATNRAIQVQIQTLQQQLDRPKPALTGVGPENIPRFSQILFDRHSGGVDSNQDQAIDTIRLYVKTLDQKGRFIPVVGLAEVQIVQIEPGHPPLVLAEKTFDPIEFDNTYRSGMTGTHYTLEIPLEKPLTKDLLQLTISTTLTDGATGAMITHTNPLSTSLTKSH